ncbi:MAG: UvrD-helicase domain-containing protein [Mycobacterium sp.]
MKFKWVAPTETTARPVPKPFAAAPTASKLATNPPKAQPPITPPPAPIVPGPRVDPVTQGPAATTADIPTLEGDAAKAVSHRGTHIQIIAAAGSGKTEVVSQRVASLLADGTPPESIVAFTFTEKAAAELKERIRERVTARIGAEATDQLGRLFVGTIHAYCFRMLQTYVPRYETYTPLDANQLTNFLYQQSRLIGITSLVPTDGTFKNIATFQRGIDVIENELIDVETLPAGDLKAAVESYYAALDRHQFMSFGTQIVRAVEALTDPEVHAAVTSPLRHLVVDEYQDVNPAQERLVELLAKPFGNAEVVVVGDDDQAIYQWRGSSVGNAAVSRGEWPQRCVGPRPGERGRRGRRDRPADPRLPLEGPPLP